MTEAHPITRVRGVMARAAYETHLTSGRHEWIADEPADDAARDRRAGHHRLDSPAAGRGEDR